MKTMKNQVTTIEQSQRLLELGVPAEKASMMWHRQNISKTEWTEWNAVWTEWELVCGRLTISASVSSEVVPAFTVGDLLEMMPNCIDTENNMSTLIIRSLIGGGWCVYYKAVSQQLACDDVGVGVSNHLIDLLIGRIEWILSNDYKLEE